MGKRGWAPLAILTSVLAGCGGGGGTTPSAPQPSLPPNPSAQSLRIATDPFTNTTSQHATQVEPSAFANGSTIVATFQDGRFVQFGASDIGYATSLDGGMTWTSGVLAGTTIIAAPMGAFNSVSDPVVTYDAAHATWLIASLPVLLSRAPTPAALVSRSIDGVHWGLPIAVAPGQPLTDKEWITCDNTSTSPFYGHCYVESDDGNTGLIRMNVSSDGGLTWGSVQTTANDATGIGGQPVVQPGGTVIVPIDDFNEQRVLAFSSHDGGASWSAPVLVSPITDHLDAAHLRSNPLIAAATDALGTVYVAWQDCRFRQNCAANDLVLSTSADGVTWSAPARVPIDATTSAVDHFIPGLGIDHTSGGTAARIALTYYYYPNTNCTAAMCQIYAGFIESTNGGSTWSDPVTLTGPMDVAWLALTTEGSMLGDYIASVFTTGRPLPVFAIANPNDGSEFNEAIYVPNPGVLAARSTAAHRSSRNDRPVFGARSDHGPRHVRPLFDSRT